MTITAKIDGLPKAQQSLVVRQERILVALRNKILNLELRLQSKIQGNLASGIGLKSQHGTSGLAGSVRVIEPQIEGQIISGSVEGGGGPFWYGKMWEQTGHKEIVPVDKKALAFLANGKQVFTMRVSAQAPRPWFLPPWQEFKPTIVNELRQTAQQAGVRSGE